MGTKQLCLRNNTIPGIYKKLFNWGTEMDASSTADRERKHLKNQTSWWCNPAMKVCLWPEGPCPLSPSPALSFWDKLISALERRRLISTDQPCFLPLEKMQGGKQKMVEEGVRAPQSEVTGIFGYQELSQEDKTSLWSLKLCPVCLFLKTHYVNLSLISQPPWRCGGVGLKKNKPISGA